MKNKIYLTGFPRSGKTTIGRLLAVKLGSSFLDMNPAIEYAENCSIKEIVDERGEDAFHELEFNMLLCADTHIVATGADTMTVARNLDWMRSKGKIVFLAAAPSLLVQRMELAAGGSLPPGNHTRQIKKLLFSRAYVYNEADYVLDVTHLSPDEAVLALKEMIYERQN